MERVGEVTLGRLEKVFSSLHTLEQRKLLKGVPLDE